MIQHCEEFYMSQSLWNFNSNDHRIPSYRLKFLRRKERTHTGIYKHKHTILFLLYPWCSCYPILVQDWSSYIGEGTSLNGINFRGELIRHSPAPLFDINHRSYLLLRTFYSPLLVFIYSSVPSKQGQHSHLVMHKWKSTRLIAPPNEPSRWDKFPGNPLVWPRQKGPSGWMTIFNAIDLFKPVGKIPIQPCLVPWVSKEGYLFHINTLQSSISR